MGYNGKPRNTLKHRGRLRYDKDGFSKMNRDNVCSSVSPLGETAYTSVGKKY